MESANHLKSEFLFDMSHKLKTPLSFVNALSRVLIHQTKDKSNQEESGCLEIIERCKRLPSKLWSKTPASEKAAKMAARSLLTKPAGLPELAGLVRSATDGQTGTVMH